MTSRPEAPPPDQLLHLRVASQSDVGLVRKNNQDSGYASAHLLVVADGMGGAAAGDLASAVAIESIRRLDEPGSYSGTTEEADDASADSSPPPDDGTEPTVVVAPAPGSADAGPGSGGLNAALRRFAAAIADANERIADLVADDYSLEGMGTTVTGAIFDGSRVGLAHIGDSRGYLLRDGHLEQLTHDHSWVQSLVDDGKITAEEAAYHPHRSLLLKVLNGQPANDPDLTSVELRAGDRLLFCSDGLCGLVDDERLAELAATPDLGQAVADLVDEALTEGGIDNITVIMAEAVAGPPAAGDVLGAESDSTTGAAAVVLGAAAERSIPSAPRRSPLVPAPIDDTDSEAEENHATPSGGSGAGRADDESRYTPGPPGKRRVLRTLLIGLAVLLITGAGLGAGYAWTRTQYYVGADGEQVAIYQGLPDGVPGLPLSSVYEVQDLPVASLPVYYQAQVASGIEVSNLAAARATVDQLRAAAERCALTPASPTPTSTSSPKATSSSAPTATSSSAPTATTEPTAPAKATPTASDGASPSTSSTPTRPAGC